MTTFTFSIENPNLQYIQISVVFQTPDDETEIQLPAWRPGRYELGNFAKNLKNFKVFNAQNQLIQARKIKKDRWAISTEDTASIRVNYHYYAAELNAGSTFLDGSQLYVNPVNCCVYTEASFKELVALDLKVPETWQIASSLKEDGGKLIASDFEELFDSPFVASGALQHATFDSHGVLFHVWFNGIVNPDWERVLTDFKKFTDKQIEKFTEFPVAEYHYINQILPIKAYHGVEHQKSTVIALGPSYDVFGDLYKELLGVSSHELYHTWNVKTIRPIEMFPYDYTKENYSRLGYICEGVTTYQGDLFLLKSGVFNDDEYFLELNQQFQKHFDNSARFNYSVADSSFDTWLDGYQPGAPGRKVSIYTEGCLLALVTDVKVLKATNNKFGLDEVMKRLYFNFAVNNLGVKESDYKNILENITGENQDEFFNDFVNGCKPYESIIVESLEYLGLELSHKPSAIFSEGKLGFKSTFAGGANVVSAMYPGGPAEVGGLMLGDDIVAVNGVVCKENLQKWLAYFEDQIKELTIIRAGRIRTITLPEVNRHFYMEYKVVKTSNPNNAQLKAFEAWKK